MTSAQQKRAQVLRYLLTTQPRANTPAEKLKVLWHAELAQLQAQSNKHLITQIGSKSGQSYDK